jgi:RNA polymerase sigma-70 factor (ECF subfamily)
MRRAVGSSPDVQRFEVLHRSQVRPLLAYALRRVGRAEEAADVVAETMLVAWRRLDEVPPGSEARPWLFGVARRVLANSRRSSRRRDRLGERLRREVDQLVGADHAAAVETNLVVRDALARLDADDREILLLTSWEGLQPTEIAVALDVPAATVRTRLHRARQRLRQQLAVGDGDTDDERWSPAGHVGRDEHLLVRDAEDER